jgi:mono/diheme cytochrome c family protein
MKTLTLVILVLTIGLAACDGATNETAGPEADEVVTTEETAPESLERMGMGPGSSMMERHHAPIPSDYAGLANPVLADSESLDRGEIAFTANCATCHGDGGMGDGPTSEALEPGPAAIAHTSQMMGDDYLFYRISEGGAFEPFNSSMPGWKGVLGEQARWDVINYVRALGSGQVTPGQSMGGMTFDPELEAIKHEQMTIQGVEQGIITQDEADTFLEVHAELDILMAVEMGRMGGMDDVQATMLGQLVDSGKITKAQADIFAEVHEKLAASGLME